MRTDAKIGLAVVAVLILVVVAFSTVFSSKNKRVAAKTGGVVTAPKESEPAPITPAPITPAPAVEPPVTIGAPLTGGPTLVPQPPITTTPPPIVTSKPPIDSTLIGKGGGDTLVGNDPGFIRGTPSDARKDQLGGTGAGVITDATPQMRPESQPRDHRHHAVSTVGAHEYTIRPSQTLSGIAAEVYGNAKFWTVIAEANKDINPNRLKVGTVIKVPDVNDVKLASDFVPSAVVAPEPTIPDRSYRVQSGDSLYRISKRLYGTSRRADEIYELNRQLIGADEAKLKLGMILKLPEPATAARMAATTH